MRLAMAPEAINVGWLVRRTEPHFKLVECFDLETNTCPIAPACGLKGALHRAQQAFLQVLDGYTLESFRAHRGDLVALLDAARQSRAAAAVGAQGQETP